MRTEIVSAKKNVEVFTKSSDAQWCGLYDRMHTHEQGETDRRLALAADFGESPQA